MSIRSSSAWSPAWSVGGALGSLLGGGLAVVGGVVVGGGGGGGADVTGVMSPEISAVRTPLTSWTTSSARMALSGANPVSVASRPAKLTDPPLIPAAISASRDFAVRSCSIPPRPTQVTSPAISAVTSTAIETSRTRAPDMNRG